MKKAVKPIKSKLVSEKTKDKSEKKGKVASPVKGGVKSDKKNSSIKVAKNAFKKAIKPIKKEISKKVIAKKIVKQVKPIKTAKKASLKKIKTTLKPVKKAAASNMSKKKNNKSATIILTKVDTKEKTVIVKEAKKQEKAAINKVVATKAPRKSKGGRKPKNKDDDDEPIIEHDILIEQLINSTKRLKKPTKIPKQLRTFTNPMASLSIANIGISNKLAKTVPKKEPKGKFELEYVIRTSAGILYEFLTSPSGLSEWFADDVNIHDGVFTFFWEGSEQRARLLGFKEDKFVRLQWLDKPEGTYFEFRIERDELTGDISLMIVDFADEASDLQTSKRLWDSQINTLLNVIGSY